MKNIFEEVLKLQKANKTFAIATITETKGSTPRNTGKMIIKQNGEIIGTIGGGYIEDSIIIQAKEAIKDGKSITVSKALLPKGDNSVNMECGGEITVFIEVINKAPRLLLIGGGHVNLAIAQNASLLNFSIEVTGNREDFINIKRFPMAVKHHFNHNLKEAIKEAGIDNNTYIVIATNHNDSTSIREVINSPAAYIGMLGSKRKVTTLFKDLKNEGFTEDKISRVFSPIGLDIGAETPEEIAISVIAELLREINKTKGNSLKLNREKWS